MFNNCRLQSRSWIIPVKQNFTECIKLVCIDIIWNYQFQKVSWEFNIPVFQTIHGVGHTASYHGYFLTWSYSFGGEKL